MNINPDLFKILAAFSFGRTEVILPADSEVTEDQLDGLEADGLITYQFDEFENTIVRFTENARARLFDADR